jgi:hypothetical protein
MNGRVGEHYVLPMSASFRVNVAVPIIFALGRAERPIHPSRPCSMTPVVSTIPDVSTNVGVKGGGTLSKMNVFVTL